MTIEPKRDSRSEAFVTFIIERMNKDKGVAAALRRADNPATEYQSWEQLAAFNIDLDKPYQRLPFAAIAAAIAKAKIEKNGTIGIGQALASCYEDGNNSDQAKAKLRRLLACESIEEVCRILRPLFSLIEAKCKLSLDFSRLLNEITKFHYNSQKIKARWAQNFYGRTVRVEEGA
jgi:CRISPR system Cascade subunit CasB